GRLADEGRAHDNRVAGFRGSCMTVTLPCVPVPVGARLCMTHDTDDTALRFGCHCVAISLNRSHGWRWRPVAWATVIAVVMRPGAATFLVVGVGVIAVMRHAQLDGLDRLAALHGRLRLYPARQPGLDQRGHGGLGGLGVRVSPAVRPHQLPRGDLATPRQDEL